MASGLADDVKDQRVDHVVNEHYASHNGKDQRFCGLDRFKDRTDLLAYRKINGKASHQKNDKEIQNVFFELVKNVRAKYVLISFNSEGFIPKNEMIKLLSSCGKVKVLEADYSAFRGSRNLRGRNLYVKEFLFLVEKI